MDLKESKFGIAESKDTEPEKASVSAINLAPKQTQSSSASAKRRQNRKRQGKNKPRSESVPSTDSNSGNSQGINLDDLKRFVSATQRGRGRSRCRTVSYTHLTLPTICSV